MCAHFSRSDSDDDEFWADMATIQDAMRVGDDIVHNSTPAKRKLGGSLPGKQPNIARDFREAEARLCRDYFDEGWLYNDKQFRRRFRMSRKLFDRIEKKNSTRDKYFKCKADATGKLGISTKVKIAAALRMLCYGFCADSLDEYLKISESTALAFSDTDTHALANAMSSSLVHAALGFTSFGTLVGS
jgi:hypothetical protein